MQDSGKDFNIFHLDSASLDEIIACFRGFTDLFFPFQERTVRGRVLRLIPPLEREGSPCFPVVTDERISSAPCFSMPAGEALRRLFHSPAAETAVFNPEGPLVKVPAQEVRLDRMKLSLIAGGLASPSDPADLREAAAASLGAGDFHRANYLFYRLFEREGQEKITALYPQVLMELGQHRQAYFMLKDLTSPEARCNLAFVYFETGDLVHAREFLSLVPPGTGMEGRRRLLEALLRASGGGPGSDDQLRTMISGPLAAEASCGLATLLYRTAAAAGSPPPEEAASLAAAAAANGRTAVKALTLLGSIKYSRDDMRGALADWDRAFALAPSPALLASRATAMMALGDHEAAAAAAAELSPWDPVSAEKVVAALPDEAPRAAAPEKRTDYDYIDVFRKEPSAGTRPTASLERADISSRRPSSPRGPVSGPGPGGSAAASAAAPAEPVPDARFETYGELFEAAESPKPEQARTDGFMSRAFTLASALEEELGKKIYFSPDGLTEVEKKLRLTFIRPDRTQLESTDIVLSCSAFLAYMIQERFRARLLKFQDFDPWTWPMAAPGSDFLTYPVQRVWRLLWSETLPDPGWLNRYLQWVENEFRTPSAKISGAEAVKKRVRSHPERIVDAETEHKRTVILASTLSETAGIETARTGIIKISQGLKARFTPGVPPTADGWKLLRCYAHLFTSVLIKDFKGVWHNTDGNDGLWSMQFPWKTFVFPIGKVYRSASSGDDLLEYYDKLMEEKLKVTGGDR